MTIGRLELPKELEERYEGLAKTKGMLKNALILSALEEWLEDQEDIARADEVMAEIKAGIEKIYSSEEVWDRLGLGN